MVAIVTTDDRIIVQGLTRRLEPDGEPISLTPRRIADVRIRGGGAGWATVGAAILDSVSVRLDLRTDDGVALSLTMMTADGPLAAAAGGETQRAGVEALGRWFARQDTRRAVDTPCSACLHGVTVTDIDRSLGFGRQTQSAIFRAGASGREPRIPVRWPELIARAERAMSAEAWAYVHGSSGLESTAEANADAFDAWRIVPRVLRDVTRIATSGSTLFGHSLPHSPARRSGRRARTGRRRRRSRRSRARRPPSASRRCSRARPRCPMERVAAEGGGGPLWFQLYWSTSDDLVESFVGAPRRSAPTRSWSRSTPRCSAGAPRPRPGVPAVHPRHGHRPVHQPTRSSGGSSPSASPPGPRAPPPRPTRRGSRPPPIRTLHRHDAPVSRSVRRKPALRRAACRGRDLPRRVLAREPAVVRPRLPAGAHEAADPAQGHPASG